MLTEDTARNIGISAYYSLVRKSFNDILKALDSQFGKPMMMSNTQNVNKVRKVKRKEPFMYSWVETAVFEFHIVRS